MPLTHRVSKFIVQDPNTGERRTLEVVGVIMQVVDAQTGRGREEYAAQLGHVLRGGSTIAALPDLEVMNDAVARNAESITAEEGAAQTQTQDEYESLRERRTAEARGLSPDQAGPPAPATGAWEEAEQPTGPTVDTVDVRGTSPAEASPEDGPLSPEQVAAIEQREQQELAARQAAKEEGAEDLAVLDRTPDPEPVAAGTTRRRSTRSKKGGAKRKRSTTTRKRSTG